MIHIDYTGISVVQIESRIGSGTLSRLAMTNDARHIQGLAEPQSIQE